MPLDQISNGLRSVFGDADMPVGLRCWAILNGDATGRILADDPVQPSYAIVQEMADGTLYVGGRLTASILAEAIHALRQDHDVVVGLWPDDPRGQLLPVNPDYTFWNAAQQNTASIALARKLGYRTEQAFRVWAWGRHP